MTVKMTCTEPPHPGGPHIADVHPDEVENWKAHGWVVSSDAEDESDDPLAEAQDIPGKKKPSRKPKSA